MTTREQIGLTGFCIGLPLLFGWARLWAWDWQAKRAGGNHVSPTGPEPAEAYVITREGERVECLIERLAADEWQATPVRQVSIHEVGQAYIDVIPARARVSFVLEELDLREELD